MIIHRLYKATNGTWRLDQIIDGRVFPLEPSAEDKKREVGFYDADFEEHISDEDAFEIINRDVAQQI